MIRRNPHIAFFRFFIPYLLFILLFLAVGVSFYRNLAEHVKEEAVLSNYRLLVQTKNSLDGKIAEVDAIGQRVVAEPKLNHFLWMGDPFKGPNVIRVLETKKALYDFALTGSFLKNYYVLFERSDLIISPSLVSPASSFYKDAIRFENVSFEEWKHLLLDEYHSSRFLPARPVIDHGEPKSYITYIQSLGHAGHHQGAVVAFIDNREILKLLDGLPISGGGWAYIADRQGNIISYSSSNNDGAVPELLEFDRNLASTERVFDSRKMIVTRAVSDLNGWSYVAVQPTEVVLAKLKSLQKIAVLFLLLLFGSGTSIALFLAYRNSLPLEALQSKMSEQAPLLRSAFFDRLIHGEFAIADEMEEMRRQVGIDLSGTRYRVAVMQRTSGSAGETSNWRRFMDEQRVRLAFEGACFLHDLGNEGLAAVFVCREGSETQWEHEIRRILGQILLAIAAPFDEKARWGIGGSCKDLYEVCRSYEEARFTLQSKSTDTSRSLAWFDDLPKTYTGYHFPEDWEARLINVVHAGTTEELSPLLNRLREMNFTGLSLSPSMRTVFLHDLLGSVIKSASPGMWSDPAVRERIESLLERRRTQEYEADEEAFHEIADTLSRMCIVNRERKMSRNHKLKTGITSFLDDSYSDPNLCVAAVAERFTISEAYVSQIVKEQTGVSFSEYIEGLRMRQAESLLRSTNLPVLAIAQEVGYVSLNTFGRAFKRIHGISATSFREKREHSSFA